MNDENSFIQEHAVKLIAEIIAAWWFVIRVLFGWHFGMLKEINSKIDAINERLARLEGRNQERDHDDEIG